MRRLLWPLFFALLAAPAAAGPIDGPRTTAVRIEAGKPSASGEATPGRRLFQVEFRGGERACAIAVGDHKPPVPMAIIVFDEKMKKVAEDYGTELVPDYVAAIWYPPRDGKYTIEVRSAGKEYNDVYITVR